MVCRGVLKNMKTLTVESSQSVTKGLPSTACCVAVAWSTYSYRRFPPSVNGAINGGTSGNEMSLNGTTLGALSADHKTLLRIRSTPGPQLNLGDIATVLLGGLLDVEAHAVIETIRGGHFSTPLRIHRPMSVRDISCCYATPGAA